MPDIRIAQEVPAVQIITPQEVLYRASITGKVCRAVVLHEGDTMLKVQGSDFNSDPRWIGKDDVISYVLTPQVTSASQPETAIEAGTRDFVPESLVIMPPMESDPRFAYNVERAKLNELYNEWMSEREYHGMVLATWHTDTPEQRDRLARYEHRYRQQLQVVAQAKSKLSSAHLAWYQEETHRLAASSFYRITADEALIADVV